MPKDLCGPFDTLNLPVMKSCSVTDLVSFYKGIHATLFPLSTVQTPVFGSYVSCLRLLFTTGSILSTWLRTVLLKTPDSKITNVWVTSPSSVCVNLTSMVLHHNVETPETNHVPSLYHRQSSTRQSTRSIYSCRSTDRTVARCLHRSIRQSTHC